MADFFTNLRTLGLYDTAKHFRTINTYDLNGNTIQFYSLDDPQKAHGPRRDILWLNEADDLTYSDYHQLSMRTRLKLIIDCNPKAPPDHWVNTEVRALPSDKVTVIHSTYLDNPFMPDEQREALERLKDTDPSLWSVYGLGLYAEIRGKIYSNRIEGGEMPEGQCVYGIDFGHTNPTAVVRILLKGNDLYWQEVVYETHLTNSDLIERLKAEGVARGSKLYCDAAEPDRIVELRRAGFDAIPAKKDVQAGIDFCQRYRIIHIGANVTKEIASYKWKENRQGDPLDEPVKYNDHAMDAGRYGTFTHYFSPPAKTQYKSVTQRETFKDGAW